VIPKHGGDPVPLPPIVLGQNMGVSLCTKMAKDYVKVLEAYRDAESEHGYSGLSRSQKQYFTSLLRKWQVRAAGLDSQYLKFGTFPRHPSSQSYPTHADIVIELYRRRHPDAGRQARAAKERENSIRNHSRRYVKRLREAEVSRKASKPEGKSTVPDSVMVKAAKTVKIEEKKVDPGYD
jgi:hypothetical protein